MMTAVIIAIAVMIVDSRPLIDFVGAHPTMVMLCLGFLLMIGLSLIAEGFGVDIPKGYFYAAIVFSIMVETFNSIRDQLDQDSGTDHYRQLPTGRDCGGTPLRHAAVLLQREQIRSPAHSLWNVARHRRH